MKSPKQRLINSSHTTCKMHSSGPKCSNSYCFFCTMNEPDPSFRRVKIGQCFKEMPLKDEQEQVLVLSRLWKIAMTQPDDPEFPSLGIFECMGKLIQRGIDDQEWLLKDQNIYIPYYAAHIIGSYTMNKRQFAQQAVKSGVVLPLMELLRGKKITWVEQRVAVRALGHIASYDTTFEAIAEHEEEIIQLAMDIACNCLETVYREFLGVEESKRVKYHCDLLTTGLGEVEMENRKAEEWGSQFQFWCLYILNLFACKERSLNLICKKHFLKKLCSMWGGGLRNYKSSSFGGIGLIRTLCKSKAGRESIADSRKVVEGLCNISRSSDDWQNGAIECLLLLLKDKDTRYKVLEISALFLVDLVEVRISLNGRRSKEVGEEIARVLLQDYHKIKYGGLKLKSEEAERALEETWDLKVERRKKEGVMMSEQELEERKHLMCVLKKEGNKKFWCGEIEKAIKKYTKALDLCPLKFRKERVVLYSNRAQCYLLLRKPEDVIRDTTRALCLCSAANPHKKSLWRRAQGYDMKGLAKESLMDCLAFISCSNYNGTKEKSKKTKNVKIPYYTASLIQKHMNATWLFAAVADKSKRKHEEKHGEDVKGKGVQPQSGCSASNGASNRYHFRNSLKVKKREME